MLVFLHSLVASSPSAHHQFLWHVCVTARSSQRTRVWLKWTTQVRSVCVLTLPFKSPMGGPALPFWRFPPFPSGGRSLLVAWPLPSPLASALDAAPPPIDQFDGCTTEPKSCISREDLHLFPVYVACVACDTAPSACITGFHGSHYRVLFFWTPLLLSSCPPLPLSLSVFVYFLFPSSRLFRDSLVLSLLSLLFVFRCSCTCCSVWHAAWWLCCMLYGAVAMA